jgi:glycogen phosphorylase
LLASRQIILIFSGEDMTDDNKAHNATPVIDRRTLAYFSMEIAVDPSIPTYSGGLGILAGDTIRAAADLGVPMVAVTLLYRKGYFFQRLDSRGVQTEEPVEWVVEDFLQEMPARAEGIIEANPVQVRAWRYDVKGVGGFVVPVYFLDTDLPENSDWIKTLSHSLYGGDLRYRLCQEIILGIGGVRILEALGYNEIDRYHMNEGHASLLTVELLNREMKRNGRTSAVEEDIEAVKRRCIFTTHTPVPAGHDQFPMSLVRQCIGHRADFFDLQDVFCMNLLDRILGQPAGTDLAEAAKEGKLVLNMTYLALNLSHYVNGVAKRHGEISSLMFAGYHIDAITNGVHAPTWAAQPFQELFDRHVPGWRQDSFCLRSAMGISCDELWKTHMEVKKRLIYAVNRYSNGGFDLDVLTIGFARRATPYKRAELLFTDVDRLKAIAANAGPLQIVFAGKAHPHDEDGKAIIQRIFQVQESLKGAIKIVYLSNYEMELAKLITAGVDVWLNTPEPPMEASGTSGMKAAVNGVPSFSILDGWWIEGHIEGITGWSIGERIENGPDRKQDAEALYEKLEKVVIPFFYGNREHFTRMMRHTIALNGSFFNTHRMLQQYVLNAYFL